MQCCAYTCTVGNLGNNSTLEECVLCTVVIVRSVCPAALRKPNSPSRVDIHVTDSESGSLRKLAAVDVRCPQLRFESKKNFGRG